MKFWAVGILWLLVAGTVSPAQQPVPQGGQIQVNSYTTGRQWRANVAADSEGDFVVVWYSVGSDGTDTSLGSIQARRFEADATPKGTEFQVNTYTTDSQEWPALAVGPQGDFVVVWESIGSYGTDTSGDSIQAQRYNDSGTPVGGELQVNSFTTNNQRMPAVASDAGGNFVVAWESNGSNGNDADSYSVQARLYDDSGAPAGNQFQVNTYRRSWQQEPTVAFDGQGDFVVAWESNGSNGTDSDGFSVQAQRFNDNGTPAGGEFQVNSYTTGHQYGSAVAADGQGNFVVAWEAWAFNGTDTDGFSIRARRFDKNGWPVSGEFQVNAYTTEDQRRPAVGMDQEGNFVVVWDSEGSSGTDTSGFSIQAQLFDTLGRPVGGQFQVNSFTTDFQGFPSVSSVDSRGSFVVVWRSEGSYGTDSSDFSVQGQRFATVLFADGFESADTSRWSSTKQ